MGNVFSNKRPVIFFDTETVCIKPWHAVDCLLSLSMIKDFSDGSSSRKDYKFKMKGQKLNYVDPKALEINGYSQEKWQDAVDFEDVAHEIAEFIHDCTLIAHNIDFDLCHLRNAFLENGWQQLSTWSKDMKKEHKEKLYTLGKPFICTQALSYLHLPCKSQSLNSLREHLDISTSRAHSADSDTEDCRKVYYHILESMMS